MKAEKRIGGSTLLCALLACRCNATMESSTVSAANTLSTPSIMHIPTHEIVPPFIGLSRISSEKQDFSEEDQAHMSTHTGEEDSSNEKHRFAGNVLFQKEKGLEGKNILERAAEVYKAKTPLLGTSHLHVPEGSLEKHMMSLEGSWLAKFPIEGTFQGIIMRNMEYAYSSLNGQAEEDSEEDADPTKFTMNNIITMLDMGQLKAVSEINSARIAEASLKFIQQREYTDSPDLAEAIKSGLSIVESNIHASKQEIENAHYQERLALYTYKLRPIGRKKRRFAGKNSHILFPNHEEAPKKTRSTKGEEDAEMAYARLTKWAKFKQLMQLNILHQMMGLIMNTEESIRILVNDSLHAQDLKDFIKSVWVEVYVAMGTALKINPNMLADPRIEQSDKLIGSILESCTQMLNLFQRYMHREFEEVYSVLEEERRAHCRDRIQRLLEYMAYQKRYWSDAIETIHKARFFFSSRADAKSVYSHMLRKFEGKTLGEREDAMFKAHGKADLQKIKDLGRFYELEDYEFDQALAEFGETGRIITLVIDDGVPKPKSISK
ncbi:uncharacterized protein NEMAJ01_0604 [Nematocida major]|uniref:uncharacterized protein n=1 Tax=Nematocida major TaxID=1912982 RepID=UPI00200786AC|nr:uncharacterized protein NEMAJ01_0604 [Nematocida major]KAH9385708.1 hypothetical protein NEMAJ01_0604 [Nematocida major]